MYIDMCSNAQIQKAESINVPNQKSWSNFSHMRSQEDDIIPRMQLAR